MQDLHRAFKVTMRGWGYWSNGPRPRQARLLNYLQQLADFKAEYLGVCPGDTWWDRDLLSLLNYELGEATISIRSNNAWIFGRLWEGLINWKGRLAAIRINRHNQQWEQSFKTPTVTETNSLEEEFWSRTCGNT